MCTPTPRSPHMRTLTTLLALSCLVLPAPPAGGAQEAVVNAVLFYSPTCPHCHQVINQDLPPLRQKYGSKLVIVGVDVSTPMGSALYDALVTHYAIPDERLGVPAMVVGNTVLVGSYEIPNQFPGIVERGLASGGIDWPPVDELRQALAAQGIGVSRPAPQPPAGNPLAPRDTAGRGVPPVAGAPGTAPSAAAGAPPAAEPGGSGVAGAPGESPADAAGAEPTSPEQGGSAESPYPRGPRAGMAPIFAGDTAISIGRPGPRELFLRDPVGNGMSVVVLAGLLAALAWSLGAMLRPGARVPEVPSWVFPALATVGTGVAAYLSFVEVTGTAAVCGPVGDCNTVQQSAWARLFGVLPVGVLGLAGYAALMAAWVAATWGPARHRHGAWTALWAMALLGTAFSAYLTFLEPFVIGATCAWCLTSAVVMALMLVVATGRAAAAPPPPA